MGKFPLIILIISAQVLCLLDYSQAQTNQGSKCSGYCTDDPQRCKSRGGRIIGLCTANLACCDPLISPDASCGDFRKGQRIIQFKSPNYPGISSGDLTCITKIEILKENVATRIDFIHIEMDGPGFVEADEESGSCESDMIFIRGGWKWSPPPRCGNLSGYSFLIDRDSPQVRNMGNLSLIALMSSPEYRWHIQVVQLLKRNPSGENSVDDYEVPFKSKRSLLTPIVRTGFPYPDNDSDNSDSSLVENSVLPAEHKSFKDSDYDGSIDSSDIDIPLILNGEETLISTVPWQVSLRFNLDSLLSKDINETYYATLLEEIGANIANCSRSEGFHFCGGTIISDRYILSAAHCFYGTSKTSGMVNISSIKAVVGDTNLCSDDSSNKSTTGNELLSFDYSIESVLLHYAYDGQLLMNDIALIKLKSPIKFHAHVQPIIMASAEDDFTDKEAQVSGWGDHLKPVTFNISETNSTSNDTLIDDPNGSSLAEDTLEEDDEEELIMEAPHILQSSKKFIIQNNTICNNKDLEQYATTQENIVKHLKYLNAFNSTLCTLGQIDNATNRPVATGKGDSGGPLVYYKIDGSNDVQPILVGVVSYGVENEGMSCKPQKRNQTYDYFTSVPFYRNWIDLAVLSFETDSIISNKS